MWAILKLMSEKRSTGDGVCRCNLACWRAVQARAHSNVPLHVGPRVSGGYELDGSSNARMGGGKGVEVDYRASCCYRRHSREGVCHNVVLARNVVNISGKLCHEI